ncbi:M28 family peptidase [Novosphingobium sp. H3SJ31-1]|uniref:M28 family peptidase n=1 Tax=Novosphingobium album (ex Liu et al. 2023) TaxID=3031130 RepID=A0ABT5WSM6_9SPHN|nr:M28 family peptidase [Novosphingobium album (ex Liu et al. 2023)]MDE8652751.1 M28 family peptidase [Novosphingobium album (ex Liu et al. 2023)]
MSVWLGAALAFAPPAQAAPSRADRELEARLRAHIEVLASDDFEGREPGTEGEAKTLRYLGRQWYDIGLVSGTNDPGNEWFAPVTLVAREPASSAAQFFRRGKRVWFDPAKILMLTSGKRSLVREAPLLFVGRAEGMDFTRNELAGRVAVMLDGDGIDSERQSKLLAQGASAVITVLDGDRTLDQVAARRRRSGYALAEDSLGGDLEGFVTRDAMDDLLRYSGRTLAALEKVAAGPDFRPVMLDLSASLEATTRETTIRTHNLIGKLPGRRPDAGAVLLVAHWDHFGTCAAPPAEDLICNGAIDNASGVAALTEIARRLARGPQLDRDVYFLATTAEELGLLGAHAFAENPPLPPNQIVAGFNIDSIALAPQGTPFAIVGRGMTGLDAEIEKAARHEKVKIVASDEANEYVKRQDGWALMQHDIPTVMVTTAYGDISRIKAFFDGDYHRPSDDLSHPLQLGGEVDDVKLLTALARWFGDLRRVPMKAK